jgi:hypothetical protein
MSNRYAELPESIRILEEQRTAAEHWASVLRGLSGKISESSFNFCRSLYVDGEAAANGWIKKTQTELKLGNDINQENYCSQLNEVAVKAQTFMENVAALAVKDQTRGWEQIIPSTITAIVDAGLKLFREFRPTNREKRESLIEMLDGLMWKPFSDIKAEKTTSE